MAVVTGSVMAVAGTALSYKEGRDARKANEAQQRAALGFQGKNLASSLRELKEGYRGSEERMAGQMAADRGTLMASLARGGGLTLQPWASAPSAAKPWTPATHWRRCTRTTKPSERLHTRAWSTR